MKTAVMKEIGKMGFEESRIVVLMKKQKL